MSTPEKADEKDALLRVVEKFALLLTEAGMPRMPARVFAYVLAEDADRYTAAELADGLRISRAAVSGAVRYLVQIGMLAKEREPGARSDHYRIYDEDLWSAINRQRMPLLQRQEEGLGQAIDLLGPHTQGARRLRETQAYLRFVRREMPKLMERWQETKDDLVSQLLDE